MYAKFRCRNVCEEKPIQYKLIWSCLKSLECADGRYGQYCEKLCDCEHGKCNPVDGECICESGWEGENCNIGKFWTKLNTC